MYDRISPQRWSSRRPSIWITSPTNDGTVTAGSAIAATIASGLSVTGVDFYVDGIVVGSDSSSPYSLSGGFASLDSGDHVVQAQTTGSSVVESLPTYVSIADAQPSTLTAPDTSGMDLSGPNVGFLEDEYGLSQAQAEAATVTSEVVGSLAEQVAARYPSSYAGSWLDYGSTTVGTVAVASSTVAATLQAELATALQPTIDIVAGRP